MGRTIQIDDGMSLNSDCIHFVYTCDSLLSHLDITSAKVSNDYDVGYNRIVWCIHVFMTSCTHHHTGKRKCHFDEVFISDCSGSCDFNNFRCSRWQKFRQNDISFLMYMLSRHSCTIYPIYYSDVIMSAAASQITSVSIVCSTICLGAEQRKYQGSASLAFVRGIHRWPVDSPHKGPLTQKMFPFDDVIM